MAWTSVGFDGTINEAQWASLAGLLGNDYVAAGNGDCVVTAVPGARSVSVAAGSLYGDGILSTNSGPETVAMTTPVNGQWYVIALRRTWATNTAALVAIAGATTTTTTPTAPPTSFPTLNTNKGVLTDQPIAWAWCNSANTTVVVYDIRLKAVKSLPPVVANANERDAKFMTPSQGLQVWRDDLGTLETYYGLYNASTNPGGRDAAGWWQTSRVDGFVPVKPTSVDKAGSGSAVTINSIGAVTFNSCSSVSINGVFSNTFKNYRIVISEAASSVDPVSLFFVLRSNGANRTGGEYYWEGVQISGSATVSGFYGAAGTYSSIAQLESTAGRGSITMDITGPATTYQTEWLVNTTRAFVYQASGHLHALSVASDGFTIYPASGLFAGTVQVYGML